MSKIFDVTTINSQKQFVLEEIYFYKLLWSKKWSFPLRKETKESVRHKYGFGFLLIFLFIVFYFSAFVVFLVNF